MNDLLNMLELKFQGYQNEIEKLEEKIWVIEDEQKKLDYWTIKAENQYFKLENKIYKLEIKQGKVQDKIDNIHNNLGISY